MRLANATFSLVVSCRIVMLLFLAGGRASHDDGQRRVPQQGHVLPVRVRASVLTRHPDRHSGAGALSRPKLTVIPSTDAAFREHVERLVDRHHFAVAADLAARLRRLFPRVVVRPSEVSGQADIWYVYRDGVWRSSADPSWWAEPRSPRVSVNREGWIEEANTAARAILGLPPTGDLPRYFSDFVAPGTLDDALDLFAVIADGRELLATMLIRPTSGEVIACDLRVWSDGERVIGAFRLADDVQTEVATVHPPAVTLVSDPTSDVVFVRYVEEAVARMPEPTTDGLELRLRRLYPHARVEAEGSTWRVHRDAVGQAHDPDEWWRAEGLPTVRYDQQGRIFGANDEAEQLLGPELVGRHWQELVTAGTTDQVAAVLRLIAEAGWAVSRFRMPRPDGYLFEFDSYTEVAGDGFLTIMRPGGGADAVRPVDRRDAAGGAA
jgi:PAS domain-containing protein